METLNNKYESHSFGKAELASMYMPNRKRRNALAAFNRWLKANKKLQEDLRAVGVTPKARIYTPLQVKIIFHYLGIP